LRFAIGVLFLTASLSKIRHPYDFLIAFYRYEIVGPPLGRYVAIMLPYLQLVVGVCLLGGVFIQGALLIGAAMMATFTMAVSVVLYRRLAIDCACFGFEDEPVTVGTLLGNIATLVVLFAEYGIYKRLHSIGPNLGH
jgi:putative oxidoreductase